MPERLINAKLMEMTRPFQTVTTPMVQVELRDYLIRYVPVGEVDNEGQQCPHCGLKGARVECNVYAYEFDGAPKNGDCCAECVFDLIDDTWDTDPARIVLVERLPNHIAQEKGYRS
jgi:hypothetical protein